MTRVKVTRVKHHDLLKGLIRLHVLHHAAEGEFYGQWMIDELARHGYKLSPRHALPYAACDGARRLFEVAKGALGTDFSSRLQGHGVGKRGEQGGKD